MLIIIVDGYFLTVNVFIGKQSKNDGDNTHIIKNSECRVPEAFRRTHDKGYMFTNCPDNGFGCETKKRTNLFWVEGEWEGMSGSDEC